MSICVEFSSLQGSAPEYLDLSGSRGVVCLDLDLYFSHHLWHGRFGSYYRQAV